MKALILFAAMTAALTAGPNQATVYLINNAAVPFQKQAIATGIVDRIYHEIDIDIHWNLGSPPRGSGDVIVLEIKSGTPRNVFPGALAYAKPYEGVHIVVFYDRLRHKSHSEHILAHVMAHEIGHVLQGIESHSESGLMKAAWTLEDYSAMSYKPLKFTSRDVKLIRLGLAYRSRKVQTSKR